MASLTTIARRVDSLRRRSALRDQRAAEVYAVRHGDWDRVAPGVFSEDFPRPVVANRIDVYASHAAAALSPLPMVSCQSSTSTSDTARDFADKRTKIANHYLTASDVQGQMQSGADQFYTYGVLVTSVEPDTAARRPMAVLEESMGFYPVWNRLGDTVEVAHLFRRNVLDLIDEYPECENQIRSAVFRDRSAFGPVNEDVEVDVVKYVSKTDIVMYLPEYDNLPLVEMANPLGRCTYVCTRKPGLDKEIRGKFDDLIWVQLALHVSEVAALQAAQMAVEAPIVAGNDVQDINIGAGAIIHANDPGSVHRLGLDVPQSAFGVPQLLGQELEFGAIVPQALSGNIDASVVTGKGVQQLMAGYSQQIANAQQSLVGHFRRVISLCFEMDEKFWPDEVKHIQGRTEATPYDFNYKPSRDIHGDYEVDVAYGGVAGLDPNRALVFLLQALGGGLVSKDYVRRNLPSSMDPHDEESKITVESLRSSLLEGMSALAQSVPQLVANGQDPSTIIRATVSALQAVQKGQSLESALEVIFPPPQPQPAEAPPGAEPASPGAPGEGGSGGVPGFNANTGMPGNLTQGLATRGPGARPDMSLLFAGTNASGNPNMTAGVSRYIPTAQ
jgi:hypothetical protein